MDGARKSLDELRAEITPLQDYVGQKIQHVRSGDWYVVVGVHFREADMGIGFTYETLHDRPVTFERPIAELLDGRWRFS